MSVTRRRLFQGAGAGLALGLVGGVGWLATGYAPRSGARPLALSPKEYTIVEAMVEALFPEEPGFPAGLSLGLPARCDEEVWSADPKIALDLKRALLLLELAPLRLGFLSRLSRLEPERRAEAIEAMLRCSNSFFVQAAAGWRQLLHLFYYSHASSWSGIGYEGPLVTTPKPPASAAAYAAAVAARHGSAA